MLAKKPLQPWRAPGDRRRGGPPPFGWRRTDDGKVVEDSEQRAVISVVIEKRAANFSYQAISRHLNKEYNVTLHEITIMRILERAGGLTSR